MFSSFWSLIEPKGIYVDFLNIIPGFARTNTPRKDWNYFQRIRKLSNGDEYILPPCEEMGGHFILLHDWSIECIEDDIATKYLIPKGQTTDFASVPKILHPFFSPLSNTVYAAVFHDYLYRSPNEEIAIKTSRKDADRIFYYGMKACGVSKLIALPMYWGVRFMGSSSYKRRE